jgi:tetratricopeptide (TPR) repeat protein
VKITAAKAQYASPETVLRKPFTARSDMYALGMILYELLTGAPPYSAPHAHTILAKHVKSRLPVLPEAFTKFQRVLDRLLARHPDERYASWRACCQALAQVTGTNPLTVLNTQSSHQTAAKVPNSTRISRTESHLKPSFFNKLIGKQGHNNTSLYLTAAVSMPLTAITLGSVLSFTGPTTGQFGADSLRSPFTAQAGDRSQLRQMKLTHQHSEAFTANRTRTTIVESSPTSSNGDGAFQDSQNSGSWLNTTSVNTASGAKLDTEVQLNQLTLKLQAQLTAGQLLAPAADNAFHTLVRIQENDPLDQHTTRLMAPLRDAVISLSDQYAEDKRWDTATDVINAALAYLPNDSILLSARTKVASQQQFYLEAERQTRTQLAALMRKAKQQMNRGNLVLPTTNNAHDTLSRALTLAPNHQPALDGQDDIMAAVTSQARKLFTNKQLEFALTRAKEGLRASPGHAGLKAIMIEAQRALARRDADYQSLQNAVADYKTQGHYALPINNNAHHAITTHLEKYPNDQRALADLADLTNDILAAADRALQVERYQVAVQWANQAVMIAPDNTKALKLKTHAETSHRKQAAQAARGRAARRMAYRRKAKQLTNTRADQPQGVTPSTRPNT